MIFLKKTLLVCTLAPIITGCEPVSIMGATAVVATMTAEERGIGGVASDTAIRTKINYEWMKKDGKKFSDINLSVQNGRVLLTGSVISPQDQIEAVRRVWTVSGVTEVLDETKIGGGESFGDYMRDAWMTTKLNNQLLWDGRIRSLNFSIRTVDRVIYIMGVAQDQKELDIVLETARDIANVRNVINLAVIKSMAPGAATK